MKKNLIKPVPHYGVILLVFCIFLMQLFIINTKVSAASNSAQLNGVVVVDYREIKKSNIKLPNDLRKINFTHNLFENEIMKRKKEVQHSKKKKEAKKVINENFKTYSVCKLGTYKKTYMDYRCISKSSAQYNIIASQTHVNNDGLLITNDGYIGVALGSKYGPLGSKFKVTTDKNKTFKVIKVEEKSDKHTINGCVDSSNAMIEVVCDTTKIPSNVKLHGDFDCYPLMSGTITHMEILR